MANVERQIAVVQTLLHASPLCLTTFSVQAVEPDAEGSDLYNSIVLRWLDMSEREVDTEVALAKHTPKTRRSAAQALLCTASAELRRTVAREKKMVGTLRHPITDTRIAPMASYDREALERLTASTFNPTTGEVVRVPLLSYISQCLYTEYCLVLLGPTGLGKTQLAKSLAKLATANWQRDHVPSPFFVATSQLDSLRYLTNEMQIGTAILLDEFVPAQAAGGRSSRLPANDLKEVLCTSGGIVGTRFGDSALPAGPRLVTANSGTLASWAGLASDGYERLDAAKLRELASSKGDELTGAIHKRCLFVFMQDPVLRAATKRQFEEGRRTEQQKRLRATVAELEPGFSFH